MEFLKRKKKKLNEVLLMTNFDSVAREDVISTLAQIRIKLKKEMVKHIGEENSITPAQLFHLIFEINPFDLDLYKRQYWWNVLKRVISDMRKDDVFIINKRTKLFVLKSEEELEDFNRRISRTIMGLHKLQTNAAKWVSFERWREL